MKEAMEQREMVEMESLRVAFGEMEQALTRADEAFDSMGAVMDLMVIALEKVQDDFEGLLEFRPCYLNSLKENLRSGYHAEILRVYDLMKRVKKTGPYRENLPGVESIIREKGGKKSLGASPVN